MGRKAMHTQEQVFEAADRLAATGREVTPASLREYLGGGSLTTIYKHHEAWAAARAAQAAPVVIDMPEAVKAAFAQCWNIAASEASKEIASIREKADAEVKAAKRRLDEAVAAIAQLEAENESETARGDDLERRLAEQQNAANAAATEAAAREAGLSATAEQLREQLAALKDELRHAHDEAGDVRLERDRLAGTLDQVRAELEAGRKEHAEALVAMRAQHEAELNAARAVATTAQEQARNDLAALRKEHTEAMADQRAQHEAELGRLKESHQQAMHDQKQRSVEVIGKLEASKQRMEAELNEARTAARDAAAQLGRVSGELDALRSQVASQEATIRGFTAHAKKADKS